MTSKSTFWKHSLWNIKKRSFVLAICFCVWFFALPVFTYFTSSAYAHDLRLYPQTTESINDMVWSIWRINFYSVLNIVITVILAIFMPIQAFSWLNKKQKVDMYKSVPVKERTRFIYTHLNSLLMFAIPFILCLVLANLVTIFLGVFDPKYVTASLRIFITCILIYVSTYMLVLIATLLTGNSILAFFGGCFMLFAEPICRLTCWMYQSYFFDTMYRGYMTQSSLILMRSITSPVATGACSFLSYRNAAFSNVGTAYIYFRLGMGVISNDWLYAGIMIVQTVVYTIIAYYLYTHRAPQTGGKNILFKKVIPVIRVIVIFVVSLGVGVITCSTGLGNELEIIYGFLGIVLSSVVLHVILGEVIEGKLNTVFKKMIKTLPISLIGCVVACSVFSIYAFDIKNYNSYLPKEDQLESFAFVRAEDANARYDYSNFNPGLSIEQMKIQDEEAKDVFLSVMKEAIDSNHHRFEYNETEYAEASSKETLGFEDDFIYEDAGNIETVDVAYNLKNGKTIFRSYCLKKTDVRKIYSAMFHLPEYKEIYNPLYNDSMISMLKETNQKVEAVYIPYNFAYTSQGTDITHLSKDVLIKLCEAAKEDISDRTYEEMVKSTPIARFSAGIESDTQQDNIASERLGFTVVIYENDERLMQVIREENLYKDITIPLDEVKEVTLYYTENEYDYDKMKQHKYTLDSEDDRLKELLEAAVPVDANLDAIDYDMILKKQYLIVVTPYKGEESTYALKSKNFPPEWKEVMKNADITEEIVDKYSY